MTSTHDAVRWHEERSVVVATIDRPERRNALTFEVVEQLASRLEAKTDGRPVVLTGAGASFCAGVDLTMNERDRERFRTHNERVLRAIGDHPGVVAAAVNGPAIGAGVMLVLGCDLRVAGAAAKFALPQTRLGFLLDARRVRYLVGQLGPGPATEMLLTCDEVDADNALRIGLVHRAADDAVAAAIAWVQPFGGWPATAGHKRMLRDAVAAFTADEEAT